MSRIVWDSMLFIYLLEGHATYAAHVRELLEKSYKRGDTLFTSYLTVGELMAGGNVHLAETAHATILEMGFTCVPFDLRCVKAFGRLRSEFRLKAPDSIHLACAAATDADLFLTGDAQLLNRRIHIEGVHFIADFKLPIL
jgi:predicted nucleic acid-binding protein